VEEMRVRDRKYQPFQGLAVKNTSGGTKVAIHLFGYFSYRIQFLRLKIVNAGLFFYTLHLDSQEEECVESEPAGTRTGEGAHPYTSKSRQLSPTAFSEN